VTGRPPTRATGSGAVIAAGAAAASGMRTKGARLRKARDLKIMIDSTFGKGWVS
jgi:hypothetical protein